MEDEILKHTQKIYKTVKNPGHSIAEKLKEIAIEIFIIVFAVSLSIWLHNRTEHSHQQAESKEFLKDIDDDLVKDLEYMNRKKVALDSVLIACAKIVDTAAGNANRQDISLDFSFNTFKANDGNYEGFKSSGKIGFIENKELKKMILAYYQTDLPGLYDVDRYQYSKHLEVWEMLNGLAGKKDFFTNPAFRAKIILDGQITDGLIRAYVMNIEKATAIRGEIGKYLKE